MLLLVAWPNSVNMKELCLLLVCSLVVWARERCLSHLLVPYYLHQVAIAALGS